MKNKKTAAGSSPRVERIEGVDEATEKMLLEAASGSKKALKKFTKDEISKFFSLALQARNDAIIGVREERANGEKKVGKKITEMNELQEVYNKQVSRLRIAASDNARLFDKAYDKLEEELKFVRKLLVRLRGLQTQVKHEASLAQHFDEFHSVEAIMQKQGKIAILRMFDETFEKLVGMVRDELDGYRLQEFLKDLRRARDNSK